MAEDFLMSLSGLGEDIFMAFMAVILFLPLMAILEAILHRIFKEILCACGY